MLDLFLHLGTSILIPGTEVLCLLEGRPGMGYGYQTPHNPSSGYLSIEPLESLEMPQVLLIDISEDVGP